MYSIYKRMEEAELKKKYTHRDRVVRAITTDGNFRATAAITTATAQEAQQRHELEPVASVLLARALTASALLASFLKGEERVVVEAMGNGLYRKFFAEAMKVGEVRGFVQVNDEPRETDHPLGIGLLRVSRVLYGKFEPVSGVVELQKSNITTDLAYYLTQSEQIPSAVRLDVNVGDDGKITHSAGVIVQAMPGASDKEIIKVHNSIIELGSVADLAQSGYQADEILRQLMPSEIELLDKTPVDFFCRCSLARFKSALVSLGANEIRGMFEAGQNELVCQYCNSKYYLTEQDFTELLVELKAREN